MMMTSKAKENATTENGDTKVTPDVREQLNRDGWQKVSVGCTARVDYNYRFDLYIRVRPLSDLVGKCQTISKCLTTQDCGNPNKIKEFGMVSNSPIGMQYCDMTPSIGTSSALPSLSGFEDYPSLMSARSNKPAIVVGFDSEWCYEEGFGSAPRKILSWQFSVIKGTELHEFVFFRKSKYLLSLELALGRILAWLGMKPTDVRVVRRYTSLGDTDPRTGKPRENSFENIKDAMGASMALYDNGRRVMSRRDWTLVEPISVVLVCHAGKADISALDQSGARNVDILHHCTEVQGGLISLQPIMIVPDSVDPKYYRSNNIFPHAYRVSLQIADTMCHAPGKKKSLKDLGDSIGWKKVELEDGVITRMDELLKSDPRRYIEYASNDSVIALLYLAALYGYNKKPPMTLTSAASHVMKGIMMNYLRAVDDKDFDLKYRGMQSVSHGLQICHDRPGYIASTSKDPVSDSAGTIQNLAEKCYHGGLNSSPGVGYYPGTTYDYDLRNAYPTAMCLVPDADWSDPMRHEIRNRKLSLLDFKDPADDVINPLTMMLGYVRFRFPESVKYPCIPVAVKGIPIYPRTSEGLDGVYACGPELYLALMLGAYVFCVRGFIINPLKDQETGGSSYSLRMAVLQLVKDRNKAQIERGKGSIEELILKTMVNSGYGKIAQNVIQKNRWTALTDQMEPLGPSAITNPVSACMITSIVRAELLAVQNQCEASGYSTYSVTTDGFISDVGLTELSSFDLYGMRKSMEQARLILTDGLDPELWEAKHIQNDLVNFTTRGNVSLSQGGVCAHASLKSGFETDSYRDRRWLMEAVLSRMGPVEYTDKEWPSLKDLENGKPFEVRSVTRHIRLDFDLKRKPDRNSFEQRFVPLDGKQYEIATFNTVPFGTVAEFQEYRNKKELVTCLRTTHDWEIFWSKIDARGAKAKVRDIEWAILFSCVKGHRAGLWKIPKLDELSGEGRCEWLNKHNTSSKKFTTNDWKMAGKKDRQRTILPLDMIAGKLDELIYDNQP